MTKFHKKQVPKPGAIPAVASERFPVILWAVDEEGIITLSEGSGLKALGIKPGGLVGQSIVMVYPETEPLLRKCLAGQECRADTLIGGALWDTCFVPMRDKAGKVIGTVGSSMDTTKSQKAEEVLRISEERLDLVMSIAHDGMWDWDMVKNISDFDPRYYRMAGYEPNEFPRTLDEWEKHVQPEDLKLIQAASKAYLAGDIPSYDVEFRFKRKDGEWMWIRGRGRVVARNESGEPLRFVGTHTDITERKLAEEALEKAIHDWQTTFDAVNDAVWLLDNQHRIIRANRATCTMLGKDPEKILGSHCWEVIHGTTKPLPECPVTRMRKSLHRESLELEIGDRCLRVVSDPVTDNMGVLAGCVHIISDTTEHKIAEEFRQSILIRQDTVLAAIPDIVVEVDQNKVYLWANHAGKEFFGDDMLGKEASLYFIGAQETYGAVRPLFEGEEDTIYVESWQRRKDGQKRLLAWWCRTLKDIEGNVTGAISTARDITEQRQIEEALRNSEMRFDQLAEQSGTFTWEVDVKGLFTYVSHVSEAILGYSPDELVGRVHFYDLCPESEREVFKKASFAAFERKEQFLNLVNSAQTKDGRQVWLATNALPLLNIDGTLRGYRGSDTDITARKQAEERLRVMADMLDTAPNAITVVNEQGEFLYANNETFDIHRCRPEEFMAANLLDLDVPESAALMEERVKRIMKFGEASFEVGHFRMDGSVVPLQIYAKKVNWLGQPAILNIGTDLTDRKRADEALRDQRWRLESIIEGTRAGTWEWNIQTGETVFNETWAQIAGYTLEELSPVNIQTWETLAHPDDLKRSGELLEKHFAGKLPYYECECRIRHKDGQWIWILDRGQVVTHTTDGKPLMMFGTHTDITERKRAEDALLESNKKLSRAQHTAKMGFLTWNLKTNVMLWSDEVYRLYGIDPLEQTATLDLTINLVHPDDMELAKRSLERALQGISEHDIDHRILRPDGQIIWVHAQGELILDTDGTPNYFLGTHIDITERKRTQIALQESEQQLRSIFHVAPTGIGVIRDRVFVDVNDLICKMVGRSREELIGQNARIVYPTTEEYERVGREKYEQIAAFGTGTVKTQWMHRDGHILDIHLSSTPIDMNDVSKGVTFTALDITQRVHAELALQESEARYRTLFDYSPDGVMLLKDGRFVGCNQRTIDLFQSTRENIVGQRPDALSPDEQPDGTNSGEAVHFHLQSVQQHGYTAFEWLHQRSNGVKFDAEIQLIAVRLSDEPHVVAFVHDVSERKRTEKEREALTHQLEGSRQRLALLSRQLMESQEQERRRIARELHDEIGQLLTAMKINLQSLMNLTRAGRWRSEYKIRLKDQESLIDTTIQQIRRIALELRPSILDDLGLLPAIRWYLDQQAQRSKIQMTITDHLLTDHFDPAVESACYRVLQEAITNVLRHAHADLVHVFIGIVSGRLRLTIQDNGQGFAVEEARSRAARGESFGLLGMQERVELIGGTLNFNSLPGQGTEITAIFPLSSQNHSN